MARTLCTHVLALTLLAGAGLGCSDDAGTPGNGARAGSGGGAGAPASSAGTGGGGTPPAASGSSSGGSGGSLGSSSGGSGGVEVGGAGSGGTGGAVDMGPPKHHLMVIEYPGRLVEISEDGQKLWEHQTPSLTVMFNVLPNGNVFYPHGGDKRGAEEIDKDHQVVWSYDSPAGELLGGERLANGNTLLGEGGPGKALELDAAKAVVRSIPVSTTDSTAHTQIRHVHRLANGNVLLALESEGAARELDPNGATVWEYEGVSSIHEAIRLPNGNTLIGGGTSKRVIEVTPTKEIAWEFNETDGPDLGLAFICSVQLLKNGNLLVANWLGSGGGTGVHAFEVTRDKQVVWKLDDHQLLKSTTSVYALDD